MTDAYKLVVLDLDGTALTSDHVVAEADQRAAEALHDAGVGVTIATGRLYAGTRQAAEALGVRGGVAVMNGSHHVNVQTHASTFARFLLEPDVHALRALVGGTSLEAFVYGSSAIHMRHASERHRDFLGIWGPDVRAHAHDDDAWCGEEPLAVGLVGRDEHIGRLHAQVREGLPGLESWRFHTFEGEPFLLVQRRGEDKGTAVHRLAAERGVTASETVVVGDWLNDVPLLREGGLSLVMSGALPEVAAHAHRVLAARRGEGGAVVEVARSVFGLDV